MEFTSQPSQTSTFPSIKQLFSDSWNNLINKLLPVFIFNSIAFGIVILAVIILITFLAGSASLDSLLALSNPLLSSIPVLVVLIIGIVASIILFSIFHIGNVLVLNNNSSQVSYKSVFRTSFSLIFQVILGQLLVSILVIGGLFFFILPGIILSILFQFVIFLIVLDQLSAGQALQRSVYIISKSFGQVFVRLLILIFIPVIFSMILSIVSGYSLDEGSFNFLNSIFSIFYSLYAISYMLTLFKQAKTYSGEGISNIRFIFLLSVIGWILALLLAVFGFRFISSLVSQSTTPALPRELNSSLLPELPEGEIIYDDDIFPSTPSAQPSARVSPSTSVNTATPSSAIR